MLSVPLLRRSVRLALLVGVAAHPLRLTAQQPLTTEVLGTVRDSATGQPLPGVVVLLLDSAARVVRRTLTEASGRYRMAAAHAAGHLRVLRLGFRPREVALPTSRTSAPVDISLISAPVLLGQVHVTAAPSCPRRGDDAAALALLEQVRAGLLATLVAREQNRAQMLRLVFERRLSDGSDGIASQSVRLSESAVADRPFGAARTGASFVRDGFRDDSSNTFFGPDAETLGDDAFAAGYCFRLLDPEHTRPHQVGLGFRAAGQEEGRIDIDGALWVDTVARALTELEFRYVGLPPQIEALHPGGDVSFRSLPNGINLVDRWMLRLVSGHLYVGPSMLTADGALLGHAGAHLYVTEVGGELASARWPDGYAWSAPLGRLQLQVVTGGGGPAAGTVVRLDGTDYRATADSAGDLEITDLLPGPYAASVVDPRLETLGITLPTAFRFVAVPDSTMQARIEIQTADDFVGQRCTADRSRAGAAWLLGRVTMRDGRAAAGAKWAVRDAHGELLVSRGQIGSDGLFQWCDLPQGATIEVDAWRGDSRVRQTAVLDRHLTILRLVLGAP